LVSIFWVNKPLILGLQISTTLLEMYVHKRQYNKFCEKEMPKELEESNIVTIEEFKDH
jgi:hypothetical protein